MELLNLTLCPAFKLLLGSYFQWSYHLHQYFQRKICLFIRSNTFIVRPPPRPSPLIFIFVFDSSALYPVTWIFFIGLQQPLLWFHSTTFLKSGFSNARPLGELGGTYLGSGYFLVINIIYCYLVGNLQNGLEDRWVLFSPQIIDPWRFNLNEQKIHIVHFSDGTLTRPRTERTK